MKRIHRYKHGGPDYRVKSVALLKHFINETLLKNVSAKVLAVICAVVIVTPTAAFMIFSGNGSATSEPAEEFTPMTVDTEPLMSDPESIAQSSSEESTVSALQSSSQAPSSQASSSQPKTVEQQVEQIKKVEKPRNDDAVPSNAPKEEYHAPSMPSQAPPVIPSTPPPAPAEKYQISMTNILQNPSLPTGCEITSLTMVLNYYKYSVSKETMADNYLPYSADFGHLENGQKYGPDFRTTFAGNPHSAYGYGCLSPAIVTAANNYLSAHKGLHKAMNVSGSSPSQLYGLVKSGIPVVVWVTSGMKQPYVNGGWVVKDTGEYLQWTSMEHCVVLTGIDGDNVIINDPLVGIVSHPKSLFETRYSQMGSQAVILQPKEPVPSSSSAAPSSSAASSSAEANSSSGASSQSSAAQLSDTSHVVSSSVSG